MSLKLSFVAGLVSFAAVTACGAKAGTTDGASPTEQALTEAQSSYGDTREAAEACFSAFEACNGAPGADVSACKTQLGACLPANAGPGPHCGGRPHGRPGAPPTPGGEPPRPGEPPPCEGGPAAPGSPNGSSPPPPPPPPYGEGGPAPGSPNGTSPPHPPSPPPPGSPPPVGGGHGGGGGPGHPGFCRNVPLPSSPALAACHAALHTCIAGGGDKRGCFEADHLCVKAAFEATFQELCAANVNDERLATLCAGGIAPPAPVPAN